MVELNSNISGIKISKNRLSVQLVKQKFTGDVCVCTYTYTYVYCFKEFSYILSHI